MGAFVEEGGGLGRDRGHPPRPVRGGILATAPWPAGRRPTGTDHHVNRMASVITLEFGTLESIFPTCIGAPGAGAKSFLKFCIFLSTAG